MPKVPLPGRLSENQMCGNCNPHDIEISVCGYPDISVITYQTDGEISIFSTEDNFLLHKLKNIKFYSL